MRGFCSFLHKVRVKRADSAGLCDLAKNHLNIWEVCGWKRKSKTSKI